MSHWSQRATWNRSSTWPPSSATDAFSGSCGRRCGRRTVSCRCGATTTDRPERCSSQDGGGSGRPRPRDRRCDRRRQKLRAHRGGGPSRTCAGPPRRQPTRISSAISWRWTTYSPRTSPSPIPTTPFASSASSTRCTSTTTPPALRYRRAAAGRLVCVGATRGHRAGRGREIRAHGVPPPRPVSDPRYRAGCADAILIWGTPPKRQHAQTPTRSNADTLKRRHATPRSAPPPGSLRSRPPAAQSPPAHRRGSPRTH